MINRQEMYAAPGHDYDERNYGPEVAKMDPYTTQITHRLGEADKFLAEITIQLSRIADKLVGATPEAGMLEKIPTPSGRNTLGGGIMEQIVAQTNILNRKITDLGRVVDRLQSL